MTKGPATKPPEATRAAILEVEPRAHRLHGPDDGRTIVAAAEALRCAFSTHQAIMSETSKRLARRLA